MAVGRGDALSPLVRAAQDGDTEAFARVVELTSGRTYALCLRLCGNEHDARDVMQDTYLRAFRSLSTFRHEASFSTWLYRIAANCAATHLGRRNARITHLADLDIEVLANVPDRSREIDPEFASETIEDRLVLIAALERLPFALRSVVVLGDVYDLTHEEIARELGISRAAVKVRLHRARRKLHDVLFSPPVIVEQTMKPTKRGGHKRQVSLVDHNHGVSRVPGM